MANKPVKDLPFLETTPVKHRSITEFAAIGNEWRNYKTLTADEAAKMLGLSKAKFLTMKNKGLPTVTLNTKNNKAVQRYDEGQLRRWASIEGVLVNG